MLTPKTQLNLRNARSYFKEHLRAGDYYMEGQSVPGAWHGIAAQKLGLSGQVTAKDFLSLCEGKHPRTGKRLTLRHNTTRKNDTCVVANRRIFYDFTISPPKSVSIVALYQDKRIAAIHTQAAKVMMETLETFAETRVRKDGQNTTRATSGCITALFQHETSRELDPHLHTHCIVFNATFDREENQWKALHASGMYRAQKLAENLYYHELAKGLKELGYEIENTSTGFEIKGVPPSLLTKFSKRHQQIDRETAARIQREGLRGNEKALRAQIAHDKRRRKIKNLSHASELRQRWEQEMLPEEKSALTKLTSSKLRRWLQRPAAPSVSAALRWAEEHLFARKAVVNDYELLAAALAKGRGGKFSLAELQQSLDRAGYVREHDSRRLTTPQTLLRETALLNLVTLGIGQHPPLVPEFPFAPTLSAEQQSAVQGILNSRDLVMLFRGGAGTGKSFTLKEITHGLLATGHPVQVLAPQHQQVEDLRRDGLPTPATLARQLAQSKLAPGSVVILDEAGQVGGQDLLALLQQVQSCGGRLILSGDTRQHGAVAASDGLRLLETRTPLKPFELKTIRRQNPEAMPDPGSRAFVRAYREAVRAAADGDMAASFAQLDALGCIQEFSSEDRLTTLAHHYCQALDRKESVLALAQTWREVREANAAIRTHLHAQGRLGKETLLTTWQPLDLTEAQKRDARFYPQGCAVFFVRNYGRFCKGDRCEVVGMTAHGITLRKEGRLSTVSFSYAARFIVAMPREIPMARGDRLQMKFTGKSIEGIPIRNGELVTVKKVYRDGRLRVTDDSGKTKTLASDQRLLVQGYAVTSYASQGKTVDTVLASYGSGQLPTHRNQWYVGISRARKNILVLTEDKESLQTAITRHARRDLAIDLLLPEAPHKSANLVPVKKNPSPRTAYRPQMPKPLSRSSSRKI